MEQGNLDKNGDVSEETQPADEDVAKSTGEHHSTEEASEKKKKVGSYILGKTLGEGSFAKVRQGVHLLAHEKVRLSSNKASKE